MTRDGKIIGYGLLLCAVALTVFTCIDLAEFRSTERSTAEAAQQLASAASQLRQTVIGFSGTGPKLGNVLDQVSGAATTLASAIGSAQRDVHGVATQIVRPCSGAAGPDACGTLAQLNKTVIKVGDAVVTTQEQVRNSQKLMDTASNALTAAAHDLDGMAGSGSATFTDLDAILKRPDVAGPDGMIANGNRILISGAGIADTTNKVFAKEAKPLLHPPHGAKATLRKLEPAGWIGLKVTACVLAGAC